MQHHGPYGIPTPPASPSYDNCPRYAPHQQPYAPPSFQPRYVPVAPEKRIGQLLEGKLRFTSILGTGAYGVVYSAVDIDTGIQYAVKCLSRFNADGTPLERRQVAYQTREINLHYAASTHSNVVSMHKIVDHPDCIYVVLECCPEGDLFQNITERGHYVGKDALSRQVFLQLLDAVQHLHNLGIYHRDLKPENILVTDQGSNVKLADFGLATSDDRSEDYGCGSTFYMSPECLDPSNRKPFYMCAPNDVWSLGVILVNLTCGRNPWKQASFQDSTYRAFARSPDFLKTILPITDELNDILGRIFNPNPEMRIQLPELRNRIMACTSFTVPSQAMQVSPPASPAQVCQYNVPEEVAVDDFEYDTALSPVSTSSDEGSLTSSGSTIDDLDDDFIQEQQSHLPMEYVPVAPNQCVPKHYPQYTGQEFIPQQYTGPLPSVMPVPPQHMRCHQIPAPVCAPVPVQAPCQPRSYLALLDMAKYLQMPLHPQFYPQIY